MSANTRRSRVAIITPYLADANNGNWQTAARYARFLRPGFRVRLLKQWDGGPDDAMIALHARRSAASIEAFAAAHPERPLVVVLTGTDLYRDLRRDADARRSLDRATAIVVLQEAAPAALRARWRAKTSVIYQSAARLQPGPRPARTFDVAVVGHLREEKDPLTAMRAAELLPADPGVRVLHIGAALDPALGEAARATAARCDRYRRLGALPRGRTRQRMRRAHLLLHPSKMEGGAQAILEAIRSGTPIVASDCAGNVGMLGADYAGLFAVGDAAGAARLIERAARDPAFYARLQRQCKKRAPLFDPAREARLLRGLVHNLLHEKRRRFR